MNTLQSLDYFSLLRNVSYSKVCLFGLSKEGRYYLAWTMKSIALLLYIKAFDGCLRAMASAHTRAQQEINRL